MEGGCPDCDFRENPDETCSDMGLAVFGVLRSELVEVPVPPALVQVVADGVQLVLGPAAGHHA